MARRPRRGMADRGASALTEDKKLAAAVGPEPIDNHVFVRQCEIEMLTALEGDARRDYYIYYV